MAAIFSRTVRSLRDDTARGSLATIALGAILLGVWASWFACAKLQLVEISERARVESAGVAHPIQSTVTGKVVLSNLVLDRDVRAGEMLVELDTRTEQLQLDDVREKLAVGARKLEFLRKELTENASAQREDDQASRAALAMTRAHETEAVARFELAAQESTRYSALLERGHMGELEALRAATEAAGRRAAAEGSALEAARTSWDVKKRASERRAMIERLYADLSATEGERAQLAKRSEQLEHEIERRKIRSSVDGRIGELQNLPEGSVVQAGAVLGAVVPRGELRVVAEFSAATALGRIERGRAAQVRLSGFAWAQYGVLRATVTSVGNEARDGRIRAELSLNTPSSTPIPLQHGLPGVVEVEVEQITPAQLVLRAAGAAIAPQPKVPDAAAPLQASVLSTGEAP